MSGLHTDCVLSVDWPCLTSKLWLMTQGSRKATICWISSGGAATGEFQMPLVHWRWALVLNGNREDWKWHSINRSCQTIKQCTDVPLMNLAVGSLSVRVSQAAWKVFPCRCGFTTAWNQKRNHRWHSQLIYTWNGHGVWSEDHKSWADEL